MPSRFLSHVGRVSGWWRTVKDIDEIVHLGECETGSQSGGHRPVTRPLFMEESCLIRRSDLESKHLDFIFSTFLPHHFVRTNLIGCVLC